jgi:Putative auto-transporter adhesin, head GIN domain
MLTLSALALSFATVLSVGEFRSIESANGRHVVVRYGATQRVSIDGDLRCSSVRVDGQRLRIDSGEGKCPHRQRIHIEVVTPVLSAISVAQGGWVQVVGAFPAQPSIDVAVEQGGTIDARAIPADVVHASVYSGGRILTISRKRLDASVDSGGNITYWGDAVVVRKSVSHAGVVVKGAAEDAQKPLAALGNDFSVIEPIPPVPPIPPRR